MRQKQTVHFAYIYDSTHEVIHDIISTDVANISQLMVFVRYSHDGKIVDDFLFCRGLTSSTTAHDMF